MKHRSMIVMRSGMLLLSAILFALLYWFLRNTIPRTSVRYGILGLCAAVYAVVGIWAWYQRRQVNLFADDLCETLDALMSGRSVEGYSPYEDSLTAKVQGKLMQYFDIMNEGKRQSQKDKEIIQGLVSDISHQVKTPVANIKMFTGILQRHELTPEKQTEFLGMMEGQINKLDFLMQSLIKMSRLETGTFTIHMEEAELSDTIARALIAKPSVLLADEPTGNLDSKTGQNVLGLLKLSADTYRQTLVMITHNLELAQTADRVIRIEDGRVCG